MGYYGGFRGGCGCGVAPIAHHAPVAPVGYGGGFALIVVLFVLLVIVGWGAWGGATA